MELAVEELFETLHLQFCRTCTLRKSQRNHMSVDPPVKKKTNKEGKRN